MMSSLKFHIELNSKVCCNFLLNKQEMIKDGSQIVYKYSLKTKNYLRKLENSYWKREKMQLKMKRVGREIKLGKLMLKC